MTGQPRSTGRAASSGLLRPARSLARSTHGSRPAWTGIPDERFGACEPIIGKTLASPACEEFARSWSADEKSGVFRKSRSSGRGREVHLEVHLEIHLEGRI